MKVFLDGNNQNNKKINKKKLKNISKPHKANHTLYISLFNHYS